ncbi:NAD(P)-dependent oxidoreductase [Streptomyces sp. NY05-11A]|uniref:NAD(P)-dependent oxidoreductase n=1 Tax=Streptomyces soliscabiei TaxID=588897 RepID=UPI0029AB4590|nr:NAD(P)-binding oxidoreductase [Streptomyces sp. NY05-11A]MDX2682736.1 SDR family oxidoreductase [Streptomyces sp. NY05-11A]
MNLLILGATGPTGRHVVDLALQAGDRVTVLARRPEALVDLADQVTVVAGDATSHHDVAKAMAGQDVVVSALGRSTSVRADGLFTRASAAVIGAAQEVGVSRLVWLSSFGVGDTYKSASATQKVMYSTFLRNIYADKEISEKAIRSSGLGWTLVYPTMLTKGPAKGTYLVGDRLPMKGNPSISRADVADFMYKAAHSPEWIHRDAVITD